MPNRTLLKAIRTAHVEGKDWKKELCKFLLAYRSTPHAVTKVAPCELLYNRQLRTKLTFGNPEVVDREAIKIEDAEAKSKIKINYDRDKKVQKSNVQIGDQVLLKQNKLNKLSTNYAPEIHRVVKRKGTCVILKNLETGKKLCRNISHVKKINNISNDKDVVDCYGQDDNGDFDANEPEHMIDDGNTPDDNVEIHEGRPQRIRRVSQRFNYML